MGDPEAADSANLIYTAQRSSSSIADSIVLGIYVFHPTIPGYPNARFPGVVIFSEIYQGESDQPTWMGGS